MNNICSPNVSIFPPIKAEGPEALQTKPKAKLLELGHPPGRKECELLSKWVENRLKGNNEIKDKQTTYEFAIYEIIREVSVNCAERGVLLSQLFQGIRNVHNDILSSMSNSKFEEQAESKLLISQKDENLKLEKASNKSLQLYINSLEKKLKESKEKEENYESQIEKLRESSINDTLESKSLKLLALNQMAISSLPEQNSKDREKERECDIFINTTHIDIVDRNTLFIFTGDPPANSKAIAKIELHANNISKSNNASNSSHYNNINNTNSINSIENVKYINGINRMNSNVSEVIKEPKCKTERIQIQEGMESNTQYEYIGNTQEIMYGKTGTPFIGKNMHQASMSTFKIARKRDRQLQTTTAMSSRSVQVGEYQKDIEMVSEEIDQNSYRNPSINENTSPSLSLAKGAKDFLRSLKGGKALSNMDLSYNVTPADLESLVREKLSLEQSVAQLRATIDELTEENDRLSLLLEEAKLRTKRNGIIQDDAKDIKLDITQISEEDKEFKNIDYRQYSNKNSKENSIESKKKQKKVKITTMAKAYIEKVLKVKKTNPELKDKPIIPLMTLIRYVSGLYSDIMLKYKALIKDAATYTYSLKYDFCDYTYLYLTNKYGNTNQSFIKRKFMELLYSSLKHSKVLRIHMFLGFMGMTNDLESNDSAVYTKILNFMNKLYYIE